MVSRGCGVLGYQLLSAISPLGGTLVQHPLAAFCLCQSPRHQPSWEIFWFNYSSWARERFIVLVINKTKELLWSDPLNTSQLFLDAPEAAVPKSPYPHDSLRVSLYM